MGTGVFPEDRSEVFEVSQNSLLSNPVFPIPSPTSPRNELKLIHHPAEFSSQSLFLIQVLDEPYLPSIYFGYILVDKVAHRRLANTTGLSPAPHPTSKSLTIWICSCDVLVCSQLKSQGTFQKNMYWDKWRPGWSPTTCTSHFRVSIDYPIDIVHAWGHIAACTH